MRIIAILSTALLFAAAAQAQVVALDPAHGYPSNMNAAMRRESIFARFLAARVADSLAARGIRSVITAPDSTDAPSEDRVARAKAAGATFSVGLHSEPPNLLPAGGRGTIIGDTTDAHLRQLIAVLKPELEQILGGTVHVLHSARMTSIRRFGVPGLMLKPGNNSDAADIAHLSTDPTLGQLAGAIARSVH